MKDIFHFVQKPYNLRNDSILLKQKNRTMCFGTESISFLVPKIWEIVPFEIKNAKSLHIFKEKKNSEQQINVLADLRKGTLVMQPL